MTQVDHQTRGHARLGGSAASIFTVCTGAPALWEGRSRKATAFTREGTAAHELAERAFREGADTTRHTSLVVEGEQVEITPDIVSGVATYVSTLREIVSGADWHAVEQTFTLDPLWYPLEKAPEPLFGSADFVAVHGDLLTVLDLKFGKGVPVSAEGNAQLLYYALGAFFALRKQAPRLAGEVTSVRIGICQPRLREEVDWWVIPLVDLILWGEHVLKAAVDAIQSGDTKLVAGKHCQFCVAKGACPALHAQAMQAAKGVFPPPAPSLLSDQELGAALEHAEILSTWLHGVRSEVETRIAHGKPVPGWKLVAKRANRQWTDERDVERALGAFGAENFKSEPELLSPAQVEKRLKAMGQDPKLIDPFVNIPVAGTTLVPDTDKRPAVAATPQDVFSQVSQ